MAHIRTFDNTNNFIGKKIKSLLKAKGVSVKGMCDDIGITCNTICNYCNKKIRPRIDVLTLIADYFGITLEELTTNDGMSKMQEQKSECNQ